MDSDGAKRLSHKELMEGLNSRTARCEKIKITTTIKKETQVLSIYIYI